MDECDNPVVVTLEKFASASASALIVSASQTHENFAETSEDICNKEPNTDDNGGVLDTEDLHKSIDDSSAATVEEDAAVDAEVEAVIMVPH